MSRKRRIIEDDEVLDDRAKKQRLGGGAVDVDDGIPLTSLDRSTEPSNDSRPTDILGKKMQARYVSRWQKVDENPHVLQAVLNTGYKSDLCTVVKRTLQEDEPQSEYRRRQGEKKTVIQWPQRKALLSEIEFLTEFGARSETVVYAGAAPGHHLELLSEMFAKHTFELWDPSPFQIKAKAGRIVLKHGLFTPEVARGYRMLKPLFISDVRCADRIGAQQARRSGGASSSGGAVTSSDRQNKQDMDEQLQWHMNMKPMASMLRFELSWKPGKTRYLDGDVRLPVFGAITGTECRLVVSSEQPSFRDYDNAVHERQMFHFNTVRRVARYPHQIVAHGLDHCYDCSAEVAILANYIVRVECPGRHLTDDELFSHIASWSQRITRACSTHRTLADGRAGGASILARPLAFPTHHSARDAARLHRTLAGSTPASAQSSSSSSSSSSAAAANRGPVVPRRPANLYDEHQRLNFDELFTAYDTIRSYLRLQAEAASSREDEDKEQEQDANEEEKEQENEQQEESLDKGKDAL
jgi:hypothetical protein